MRYAQYYRSDRSINVVEHRCDICDEILTKTSDNFEAHIKILDEIDESFASERDRSTYEQGPKLILCEYCSKAYLMPSYAAF